MRLKLILLAFVAFGTLTFVVQQQGNPRQACLTVGCPGDLLAPPVLREMALNMMVCQYEKYDEYHPEGTAVSLDGGVPCGCEGRACWTEETCASRLGVTLNFALKGPPPQRWPKSWQVVFFKDAVIDTTTCVWQNRRDKADPNPSFSLPYSVSAYDTIYVATPDMLPGVAPEDSLPKCFIAWSLPTDTMIYFEHFGAQDYVDETTPVCIGWTECIGRKQE